MWMRRLSLPSPVLAHTNSRSLPLLPNFTFCCSCRWHILQCTRPAASRQAGKKSKVFTLREFSNIMIKYIYVRMSVVYVVCALSHFAFLENNTLPIILPLLLIHSLSLSTLLCECAREHIQILPSIHVSSRPCSKAIHQIR